MVSFASMHNDLKDMTLECLKDLLMQMINHLKPTRQCRTEPPLIE